jgi:hypothetical protein
VFWKNYLRFLLIGANDIQNSILEIALFEYQNLQEVFLESLRPIDNNTI